MDDRPDSTKEEPKAREDPIKRRFADKLRERLAALNWDQSVLADVAGVSATKVSGWLSASRSISRDDVCRLAWAISAGQDGSSLKRVKGESGTELQLKLPPSRSLQDETTGDLPGRGGIEQITADLLDAAGYSSAIEPKLDRAWGRLTPGMNNGSAQANENSLKVGWFDYPPFAIPRHAQEFDGISRELCDVLCSLLGISMTPVRLGLGEIEAAVRSRKVDMLAPTLALPSRLRSLAFSEALPGIQVGLATLVSSRVSPRPQFDTKACIHCARGSVTKAQLRLLYPKEWPIFGPHIHEEQDLDNWHVLFESPQDAEKELCFFVADEITCNYAALKDPQRVAVASLPAVASQAKLPLAFGVHHDEPRLLAAINTTIHLMQDGNLFEHTYKAWARKDPQIAHEILKKLCKPKFVEESSDEQTTSA